MCLKGSNDYPYNNNMVSMIKILKTILYCNEDRLTNSSDYVLNHLHLIIFHEMSCAIHGCQVVLEGDGSSSKFV